jgi:hypothetical protein
LGGEVVEKGGKGLVFFVGFGEDEGGAAVGVGVAGWGVGVAGVVVWLVGRLLSSKGGGGGGVDECDVVVPRHTPQV